VATNKKKEKSRPPEARNGLLPKKIELDCVPQSTTTADFSYCPTTCHIARHKNMAFKLVGAAKGGKFKLLFIKNPSPFPTDISSAHDEGQVSGSPGHYYYIAEIILADGRKFTDVARCPTIIVN
jgi:hypothetical protein